MRRLLSLNGALLEVSQANPPSAPARMSGKAEGGDGAPVILHDQPGRFLHTRRDLDRSGSGPLKRARKTEPVVVVPVARRVPVAVGGAQVLRVVVPRTAAVDAVRA